MTFLFSISVCFLLTINNLIDNHINDIKCLYVLTKSSFLMDTVSYIGMKITLYTAVPFQRNTKSSCLRQCFAQNSSDGTSGVIINMAW